MRYNQYPILLGWIRNWDYIAQEPIIKATILFLKSNKNNKYIKVINRITLHNILLYSQITLKLILHCSRWEQMRRLTDIHYTENETTWNIQPEIVYVLQTPPLKYEKTLQMKNWKELRASRYRWHQENK